jgi:hypothetical protein
MLLLANNADPNKEDLEGVDLVSIRKRRSNLVVRMLLEKGAAVRAYGISSQDQELFRM